VQIVHARTVHAAAAAAQRDGKGVGLPLWLLRLLWCILREQGAVLRRRARDLGALAGIAPARWRGRILHMDAANTAAWPCPEGEGHAHSANRDV